MGDERLRHQLEIQAAQIDKIFARYQIPAVVAGGEIGRRIIQFDIQGQLTAGWERLRQMKNELAYLLGTSRVRLYRADGRLRLEVMQLVPMVDLLDMHEQLPSLPPATTVLGLTQAGQPVLLNLQNPQAAHTLIIGDPDAGKTSLLTTLMLSLALRNRQSQVQMLLMQFTDDGRRPDPVSPLHAFNYLPHMLNPLVFRMREGIELLHFLLEELAYRLEHRIQSPVIAVGIDNCFPLLWSGGEPVQHGVKKLLKQGAVAGIHLLFTVPAARLSRLHIQIRAGMPVRLMGRVLQPALAAEVTKHPDGRLQELEAEGDFYALVQDRLTRFQGAYINNYDLHHTVEKLHRQRGRTLIAEPLAQYEMPEVPEPPPRKFRLNGGVQWVELDP